MQIGCVCTYKKLNIGNYKALNTLDCCEGNKFDYVFGVNVGHACIFLGGGGVGGLFLS